MPDLDRRIDVESPIDGRESHPRIDVQEVLLAGALLAVLALLFTYRLFTPSPDDRRWIVAGDFSKQFYPFARFVADELAAGRLPLWNPFIFGGHPFQADPQTAVFYPISTAIAALLGRGVLSYRELELEIPIHLTLAALGTYLAARQLSGSRPGAWIAAIAYGFGGFLTSYPVQQLAMLRTAAWIPWLVLGYALGRRRDQWLALSAAAFGLMLFAGHTQTALFAGYLGLAYGIVSYRSSGRSWLESIVRAGLPLAAGAGLAAVQLLPTLEFVGLSTRTRLDYEAAAYGYELKALPGILLPGWRGEKALYVGTAALALGALAIIGRSRSAVFWGCAALFALIVSVGGNTFLYRALFLLAPGWATFRDQERTTAISSLALALLASLGVAQLNRLAPQVRSRFRRWLAGGLILSLLLTIQSVVLWSGASLTAPNPYSALLDNAVFLTVLLGLLLALVSVWWRLGHSTRNGLLVGLLIFDLFTINWTNNLSAEDPNLVLAREALLAAPRQEQEPYRIRSDNDKLAPPNLGMVWRTPMMTGDSPIQLRATHSLLESPEEWRLWHLFNVKYMLSGANRQDDGLELLQSGDVLNVYRVRFSLPRAWAVSDVRVIADEAESLAIVLSPDIHPGDVAIVATAPELPISPGVPRPDVLIVDDSPQHVTIQVRAEGNALLVVADAWHPAWQATIDGTSTPVIRANHAFRAIAIPPGDHVVEMSYRPRSLYAGAIVSAATALSLIAALVALGRRHRNMSRTGGAD